MRTLIQNNSKQNDLDQFKDTLQTFHYDTGKIIPNNEAQEKALEKKVVINTPSKLYDKLLSIYTTQYDKISEDLKKRTSVLCKPEMLILDFDRDDLPQMPEIDGNEEVKLEPEETVAGRLKLNPR